MITFSSVGSYVLCYPVADPGFPVGGGMDLVGGAVDPRGGYISKILHVKTKESGPIGGARAGRPPPLDPPMLSVARWKCRRDRVDHWSNFYGP